MITAKCELARCRNEFQVREADRKRGWGRFCSKSCKANHQAKIHHRGGQATPTRYTLKRYERETENNLAALEQAKQSIRDKNNQLMFEQAMSDSEAGWTHS